MSWWLLRVLVVVVIACSPVGLFHQHAARAGWRTVSDLAVDPDQFVACTDGLSFVVGDTNLDFTDPATLPDTLTHPFVAVSPPYDGSGPAPADLIVSPAGQTITLQKRPCASAPDSRAEPTQSIQSGLTCSILAKSTLAPSRFRGRIL